MPGISPAPPVVGAEGGREDLVKDGPAQPKPPPSTPPEGGEPSPAPAPSDAGGPAPLRWRDLWPIPALLVATGLLAYGVVQVVRMPRDHDFPGALDQVDGLVERGLLEEARVILFDRLAPKLEEASALDKARFDAVAADWISEARTAAGFGAVENDRQIAERYGRAEAAGLEISRERMLRWATALVQLGRTDEALALVARLGATDDEDDALRLRIRRMVMERAWSEATRAERIDWEAILVALGAFRADPRLPAEDEAWAAARQAEARIALERHRDAADRLLLDLRRLEAAAANGRPAASSDAFAELSGLLGRAYAALGEPDLARDALERAVALSTAKSLARGEALVLLGQLALEHGEGDEAEQRFESVLADYQGTPLHPLALFGRAETAAARGDHDAARADFRDLRGAMSAGAARRVRGEDAVGSLLDRHDALLVAGELAEALEYARLAADFLPGRATRPDILLRLGTTARSLAARLAESIDAAEPEVVARRARLLKSAGDWFLAHSAHPDAVRESAEGWADSLWLAADSYEAAGWRVDAIEAFRQFVEARPTADLRRADAMFRIAAMLHAEGDFAEAAAQYARLIDEFPESPAAARATVPLARCLEATDRRTDAIARLRHVVEGSAGLRPDSAEYRGALLELGRLTVAAGDLPRAAVLLDEALRRYPDDERAAEVRFELGECRRGLAREAARRLADGALSSSQRTAIDEQRRRDLESARGDFDAVIAALDARDQATLDPLERDALRMAYLYRADCLFDLGRYREAIDFYEIAERRYADNAVSMVALIQIVNAWHELGEAERAATAERRAEIRLAQLSDDAFLAGDSILSRESWERWLRHRPPGPRMALDATRRGGDANDPPRGTVRGAEEEPE